MVSKMLLKNLANGLRVRCLELKGLKFETEEMESFLRFKLSASPEAFKEAIDHMNNYEEANTAQKFQHSHLKRIILKSGKTVKQLEISALSPQKNNSESRKDYEAIVKDDIAVEVLNLSLIYDEEIERQIEKQKKEPSIKKNTVTESKIEVKSTENKVEVISSGIKDDKEAPSIGRDEVEKKGFLTEEEKKKVVCKFLKRGKCKHGWSGRKFEEQSCSYNHPEVCNENRLYGKCPDYEMGECTKIHLHICYEYMDTLNCKYGKKNCRFWHPPRLEDSTLDHERKQDTQRKFRDTRVFRGKNQMNHSFLEENQGQKSQSPFLGFIGQKNGQQEIQTILRRLEQLELRQNQIAEW